MIMDRNKLIEELLPDVLESLYDYTQMGVDEDEIVGEASLILTETVDGYLKNPDNDINAPGGREKLRDMIDIQINERITEFITESNVLKAADQELADRLNDLSDAAMELLEELGHAPSNEELAEKLETDVDEIERLLKISENASKS